jgi:hypothetical protein
MEDIRAEHGELMVDLKKIYMAVSIISILIMSGGLRAGGECLGLWEEFSRSPEKVLLINWMNDTARKILFKNSSFTDLEIQLPPGNGCYGIFVTLIRRGKVRGCFGAFSHKYSSLPVILRHYIKGAMFFDPRYKPLERHELYDTEIILTVTSLPEPVDDINNVDISNFGVFIDCDDSGKTVIVPAEFRTASCAVKNTVKSRCRFYSFRAVTLR